MSAELMKAVVFKGDGKGEVQQIPVPVAKKGWLIIAPVSSGICGTDMHISTGEFPLGVLPVVPGHEFGGHVVSLGEGVTEFKVGDWVGADPNMSCGSCDMCLIGATNLCESIDAVGISLNGSMAEFVAVPATSVFHLSDQIDEIQAPLIEPLSCVLHALERAPDWSGKKMIIFGAGAIGLTATVLAVSEGVQEVVVVEPQSGRHALAIELGASRAVSNISELGDEKFNLALDASGHPAAITAAISVLGKRGRLIQMGVAAPHAKIELSPYDVYGKELSIIGSASLAQQYENAVNRMSDLGPKLSKLVTGRFKLEEINEAIAAMKSGNHIKVLVHN